jgi:hypothetical protein
VKVPLDVKATIVGTAENELIELVQFVPSLVRTFPDVPGDVNPVPPEATGIAADSPVIVPPEMTTLESAFVPFPMPFMPFTTVVKFASN